MFANSLWSTTAGAVDLSAKRLFDLFFSCCGLLLLSPVLAVTALSIRLADGGDVLYRQTRVGLNGRPFRIYKFRTMVPNADQLGPSVTKEGDARVTWIGRILRKTKLDELPQLWNVVSGDMSLVGPRPEVPRYVQKYTLEQREILRLKPGITDLASLRFRDEESLLGNSAGLEEFYVEQCIPRKLRLNRDYAQTANLLTDTWIILRTICPYWVGVLATYAILLATSFELSYQLIYDFVPIGLSTVRLQGELLVVVAVQLACLMWRKQCTGLLSYFSFPELRQVVVACGLAALLLLISGPMGTHGVPPRNVIIVNFLVSLCLLAGFRTMLRLARERSGGTEAQPNPPTRVGIIGAGSVGAKLALELALQKKLGRTVVAFFDDDFQKWNKRVHEVPVVGMPECLVGWTQKLDEVVIAMPGAPAHRLCEIDQLLRRTSLKFYSVSSLARFWICEHALGNMDVCTAAAGLNSRA
jgi:lipopolysaccharide/colanic/teichoic acid biosynthesis glycosyltransferase